MSAAYTKLRVLGLVVTLLAGCSSAPPINPIDHESARALFAARGIQPGQKLPLLRLTATDGHMVAIPHQDDQLPIVIITCSITCNVARRDPHSLAELLNKWRSLVHIYMVYTLESNPAGSYSPYVDREWIPTSNISDGVSCPQPTALEERVRLADRFSKQWAGGVPVLVDAMDNAAWKVLGGPHVAICVDASGVVRHRWGWFEASSVDHELTTMLQRDD